MNLLSESKGFLDEFKTFILKGNVVDLAVGVVIGTAFKGVVDSIVAHLITPLVAALGGEPDFSAVSLGPIKLGLFLNAIVSFLIIGAVVFFLIVKPMNALIQRTKRKAEEKPAEPAPLPDDVKVLMEIRDLLRSQQLPGNPAPPARPL